MPPSVHDRLTRHRQSVRNVVTSQPEHLTAAQIYDLLCQQEARMAFGTVYNALHYLVGTGLLAEVRRSDGVIAYDQDTSPHDHVTCRLCGRLADVPPDSSQDAAASTYEQVAQRTGFTVEQHNITFVGVCPDCRRQTIGR